MKPKSKGRPKAELVLTEDEFAELRRHARRSTGAQHLGLRSKIVLRCAEGATNAEVADALDVREATVSKWRGRFVRQRLDGLRDAPRPGAKRRLTDEHLEELVRATLELTPSNATHWSTRSMAKHLGLNQTMVSRVWRAFGLKPHRAETFSISTDPLFVDKVRDIVGLYMNPPDNALVLCVDEKSQIQALERTQLVLPMMPGVSQRHTHGYFRHGTTTLFAALDTKTGKVIGHCYRRHRATEFIAFLARVDAAVPAELDVHLVMDNYATHKTPAVKRWLKKRPRFHVHFTPTYASWLNQVERWFGLLSQRKLRRSSYRSTTALETDIRSYIECTNDEPNPFVWTKTADDILASLARYCSRIVHATSSSANL